MKRRTDNCLDYRQQQRHSRRDVLRVGSLALIGLTRLQVFAVLALCLLPVCHSVAADRPNIFWVNSEDNGAQWLSCYGSPNAHTPNLDKLAADGFRYMHCYSNSAVCAPTRTTWITGVHAISMGTQPMRSRYAIPHNQVPYFPDQLQKVGYYTSNSGKSDYNIGSRGDSDTWKGSKVKARKI